MLREALLVVSIGVGIFLILRILCYNIILKRCKDFLNVCDILFNVQLHEKFSEDVAIRIYTRWINGEFCNYSKAMHYIQAEGTKMLRNVEEIMEKDDERFQICRNKLTTVLYETRLWLVNHPDEEDDRS